MFKMILFFFLQYLLISEINCNAINSVKVENADFTFACSKLTAQRIAFFSVIIDGTLNCFDEYLLVSFDLVDIRNNNTKPEKAFLTKDGSCLAEQQATSKICQRIRRFIKYKWFLLIFFCNFYFLRYKINDQKVLLRINGEIDLVEIESAETMISRRLFATNDYIGWILHKTQYYNEYDDTFLYFNFLKDLFIILYFIRLFIKILKEIYDWYLSFKYYLKEIKQCKNKLKRN
jgi:hypothetical protein